MASDPIESATKGATEGVLNWTKDQIKDLVAKFRNRDVSFLEDPNAWQIISEERKTSEGELSHRYIKDKELRTLATLGLTMRRVEREDPDKLQSYRNKIAKKFGGKGLHVAEFFQHGLYGRYIGVMVSLLNSVVDLERGIEEILTNIDKYVVFIQGADDVKKKGQEITTRIQANQPSSFIMAGVGNARNKAKSIFDSVSGSISGYEYERNEDEQRITFFFKKKQ